MKNKLIFLVLLTFLIFYCSSEKKVLTAGFKPPEESTESDVKSKENKKLIYKQKPEMNNITGIKIVLFESADKKEVEERAKKALVVLNKSINIFNEDGLWKILIEGFKNIQSANNYIDNLNSLGWKSAYIYGSEKKQKEELKQPEKHIEIKTEYQIQLAALTDKSKAYQLKNNLINSGYDSIEIVKEGNFWKVRFTKIYNENRAKKILEEFKRLGFEGAWIVKK